MPDSLPNSRIDLDSTWPATRIGVSEAWNPQKKPDKLLNNDSTQFFIDSAAFLL